ncbi:hypothetical protein [Cohnella luojiensis]|uniref:Uncharacterized protein n=1 Tax=Cohnella luojiensis TaxID=652876 RepID=A0A4Y8LQ15_9BACL|nr:hypothetical protein [Cohnella luojiensis]TFE22670.1 hypothetical protein E2980_21195 [Cohnella luojiensis]
MSDLGYLLVWILLLALPICALWHRRWWPFSVYVLGCFVFLYSNLRENGGWDDLADIATLLVVVIPICIVGSIVWVALTLIDRHREKNKVNRFKT